MIIAIVILSVLFIISLILNIFFIRVIRTCVNTFADIQNDLTTIQTLHSNKPIPEGMYEKKYPHADLIIDLEPENESGIREIYDVSNYEKNRIIGLTQFVPQQELDSLEAASNIAIRAFFEDEDEELNEEELDELFDEVTSGTIIPDVTVYQLKGGQWLWRPE